uniref:Uncharacterized protein n=1 Tax=Anopheles epiroticus TaxID=199890 RepID=A0A182PF16_9DIPT
MANNVAGKVLVCALMLFFTVVVTFLCYAMTLHTEKRQMWSTLKERGALRTMPNGTANYWYYICKTILRRNKPTYFNISVHVPKVLNTIYFQVKTYYRLNDYQAFPVHIVVEVCAYFSRPSDDVFSRHLMSIFYETIPDLLYYCPHGNTTYHAEYWLEDKFFPKSMPAGDYRQDVWFRDEQNSTIFSYQAFFSCKNVLRRNKPIFANVTLHVPQVLNAVYFRFQTFYRLNDYQAFPVAIEAEVCAFLRNPSDDYLSRYLMSVMLETSPHMIHPCPYGVSMIEPVPVLELMHPIIIVCLFQNRTYNAAFWMEDRFFPKSVPAGDFRMDGWLGDTKNRTLLAVSELLECKSILRRNKPTFLNVSLHIPKLINTLYYQVKTFYRYSDYRAFPADLNIEVCAYFRNPSEDVLSRHFMSVMFEVLPELLYYCPHGNRTYNIAFWMEDRFFPKSVPAGDFRQDVRFGDEQNKTIFAYQAFFSVRRKDFNKIDNMTDNNMHLDASMRIVPTAAGFRVFGKEFEIHFDRINGTNVAGEDGTHPQEDYTPTLVKRKTYVWELTGHKATANITVPVFHGKHSKQDPPPFQNAIPPAQHTDTGKE